MHPSSARVLSVAILAGAVLASAVPVVSADPAAEVRPAASRPGGSVTVSVSCDPFGGKAPATVVAKSKAFPGGTLKLNLVPGNGNALSGPAYRGTARIPPAASLAALPPPAGSAAPPAADPAAPPPAGSAAPPAAGSAAPPAAGSAAPPPPIRLRRPRRSGCAAPRRSGCSAPRRFGCAARRRSGCSAPCRFGTPARRPPPAAGTESSWTVEGTCPAAPGAKGKPFKTTFIVARPEDGGIGPRCTVPRESCKPPVIQHGVKAGKGGDFGVSVPALVTGGLLIAGALGAAVYRLWRRDSSADA
ncbi:hypothetical protein StrepF001_23875 [Streptomyces sp. F001]|uniref:hypothetical protein n=1 Tax=Streptomyces sp. F001 TaxID=1510026 RepID=UPI00101E7BA2|nr:hypothetical protein [Streptomyces sp. F001]RZB16949.1 hypothetical protein StrepF001_23875 [Streptomyces sp. F001]